MVKWIFHQLHLQWEGWVFAQPVYEFCLQTRSCLSQTQQQAMMRNTGCNVSQSSKQHYLISRISEYVEFILEQLHSMSKCEIALKGLLKQSLDLLSCITQNLHNYSCEVIKSLATPTYFTQITQQETVEEFTISTTIIEEFLVPCKDAEGETLLPHIISWTSNQVIQCLLEFKIAFSKHTATNLQAEFNKIHTWCVESNLSMQGFMCSWTPGSMAPSTWGDKKHTPSLARHLYVVILACVNYCNCVQQKNKGTISNLERGLCNPCFFMIKFRLVLLWIRNCSSIFGYHHRTGLIVVPFFALLVVAQ
ncbi:hypothetical protein Pelo_9221 [Pelomyxa schiedti]|nr:hypothetical protein Pelo_9221 [Pelomyxa schiedti]